MPQILHPPSVISGVPRENAFHVLDDAGMKQGSASVIEYINEALLPDRPLNYFINLNAVTQRAFDMLIGAVIARSLTLKQRYPNMPARLYTTCQPNNVERLHSLQDFGFQNDDAEIRMRRFLNEGDPLPLPPEGCVIAPVIVETQEDYDRLLRRVNKYSATAKSINWLMAMQEEQLFTVFGVWENDRLIGELILTVHKNEGRIEMLYTRPAYRNMGVATALIAFAGDVLLQAGIGVMFIDVWRRNRNAMSLLQRLNFDSVLALILYPGIDLQ